MSSSEDILLVSGVPPHLIECPLRCLCIHHANVFENILESILHPLGHADLPANIDVASFPENIQAFYFSNLKVFIILSPYPMVIYLSGIPSEQVLNILFGLIRLPRKGNLSLKLKI